MRAFLLGAFALLYPLVSDRTPAPLKPPVIDPLLQRAPVFEYRSLDGTVHRLSELRGKVVVIDFWGRGVRLCRGDAEATALIRFLPWRPQRSLCDGFLERSPGEARAFIAQHHLTLPIYYLGTTEPPKGLASSAWPATYFVSPTDMLRGVHLGGADWSDKTVRTYIEGLRRVNPNPKMK